MYGRLISVTLYASSAAASVQTDGRWAAPTTATVLHDVVLGRVGETESDAAAQRGQIIDAVLHVPHRTVINVGERVTVPRVQDFEHLAGDYRVVLVKHTRLYLRVLLHRSTI